MKHISFFLKGSYLRLMWRYLFVAVAFLVFTPHSVEAAVYSVQPDSSVFSSSSNSLVAGSLNIPYTASVNATTTGARVYLSARPASNSYTFNSSHHYEISISCDTGFSEAIGSWIDTSNVGTVPQYLDVVFDSPCVQVAGQIYTYTVGSNSSVDFYFYGDSLSQPFVTMTDSVLGVGILSVSPSGATASNVVILSAT